MASELADWGWWGRRLLTVGLLVGALCAALAVFIPWMLSMQAKGIASRIRSDLRSASRALEEYRADHGRYPAHIPMMPFTSEPVEFERAGGTAVYAADPGSSESAGLTTPIAYMTALYSDPMAPGRGTPLAYWSNGSEYVVYSAGVDHDYDILPGRDLQQEGRVASFREHLIARTYDPTNGALSSGDLWRASTGERSGAER